MENNDLYRQWRSRDDRRLALKPLSVRLPTHVAARVAALCDMFPTKTKTEIITDILKVGLDAFENSLPPLSYADEPQEEDGRGFLPVMGVRAQFYGLADRHNQALEKELGNKCTDSLFEYKSVLWQDG